ncbi:MAG TPA: UDP-N-acetylmuramoyl-tripeptide--D-alanyl-D-alanine ligase [Burkholderiales bacterium]|nr:UDP-N-acetylmuramoyl-tripeptide--D-alanyl-D-alanine ligase [Burkholderiales bacterium]
MSLAQAAAASNARLVGADGRLAGVSTDSRTIAREELFVAIRGEYFDGHAFLDQARQRGAAGAMVDEAYAGEAPLPLLVVDETRRGLGRLGARWRERFGPTLVAVTGSNGKTTTKEMLASILRAHAGEAAVLATRGNLNTDIGVPLTLLGMRAEHRYAAVELGMNHPGEIAMLAAIAQPTVAVVTNAQREHLEFMRTVDAVAEENSSVFDALPADGTAVWNADDPHAAHFRERAGARRTVDFALDAPAAVTASYTTSALASEIRIRTPVGEAAAPIAAPGVHNVRNALAASACAVAAGVPVQAIAQGLRAFRPYSGRSQVIRLASGATLIDDSYNANPDSVRAAIDALSQTGGRTLLVLGDMGEVGDAGPQFHREVGRHAAERGIGGLYGFGAQSALAVSAFGAGARHFAAVEELVEAIRTFAASGTAVLVKGSRFMKMERVVAALTGRAGGGH